MLVSASSAPATSSLAQLRSLLAIRRIPLEARKRIPGRRLDLRAFRQHLETAGLSEQLPYLESRIEELADYNERVFGFSFDPADIRIAERDLPRMTLGLREGILVRPLVIDSPRTEDAVRLGLDLSAPMLRYRYDCLARSGIRFIGGEGRWEEWRELRTPWHGSLADRVRRSGCPTSPPDFWGLHPLLPPPSTIGERLGAAPRLVLVGPDTEPFENRLLATGPDGEPVVRTMGSTHSAGNALRQGCRFLSHEGALLLLGTPDLRSDDSTMLASMGAIWLSAVNPFGRLAMLRTHTDGVELLCQDPQRDRPFDRVPASSE